MDHLHPNRFRNRKSIPAERLLGIPPYTPPHIPNPTVTVELLEDDVVFSGDYCTQQAIRQIYNPPSSSPPSSSSTSASTSASASAPASASASATPIHPHSFGILAALPDHETHPHIRSVSKSKRFSKSSSTRVIPSIPKPAPARDRIEAWISSSYSNIRLYQSVPLNCPELPEAVLIAQRRRFDEEEEKKEEAREEESDEVFPPHEVVAKNTAKKSVREPVVAYSLMEGAGRTLKGRDMRQVRNAILRQTGFLD